MHKRFSIAVQTGFILAVIFAPVCSGQRGASFQGGSQHFFERDYSNSGVEVLHRDKKENIYVAVGYATYLEFPRETPIEDVVAGAKSLVHVEHNEDTNSLTIIPLVMSGSTNLTVVMDGVPYVFLIHIRSSGDIDYRRTFTLGTARDALPGVRFGPPLEPGQIDVVAKIREIEDANKHLDRTREGNSWNYYSLNKAYSWNGNIIYLSDAFGWPEENLVVLRLTRRNFSQRANYLHVRQIEPFVANTRFPVSAGVQSQAVLYPGQMDKIYLFIQGYNIFARNEFELALPPEAQHLEGY